jgi:hypothetical protein
MKTTLALPKVAAATAGHPLEIKGEIAMIREAKATPVVLETSAANGPERSKNVYSPSVVSVDHTRT